MSCFCRWWSRYFFPACVGAVGGVYYIVVIGSRDALDTVVAAGLLCVAFDFISYCHVRSQCCQWSLESATKSDAQTGTAARRLR